MFGTCALAIEVSEDRAHASIAAAAETPDGVPVVELACYLDGTALTVAEVLRLREERRVLAVVIDPRSRASNLIRALTAAGVAVTEPTQVGVAAAEGQLRDDLEAGRLKFVSHPALSAAASAATERPVSDGAVWRRRGSQVDTSPISAATLALWAWSNKRSRTPHIW